MARTQDNPILNSPYEEPGKHYATDTQGNLSYRDVRPGRRIFAPDVPQIPLGQQKQGEFFDLNDNRANCEEYLVNRLRELVSTATVPTPFPTPKAGRSPCAWSASPARNAPRY